MRREILPPLIEFEMVHRSREIEKHIETRILNASVIYIFIAQHIRFKWRRLIIS